MQFDEVLDEINTIDEKDYYSKLSGKRGINNIAYEELAGKIVGNGAHNKKAVLGIDIFHYSQYEDKKQALVPIAFKLITEEAKNLCKCNERVIFYNDDPNDSPFIDTGDGGFFIFKNPLQAFVFNFDFYTVLKAFNTGHFYPKLHSYLGDITLRTCVTYDTVYTLNDNYYGAGIIHNARILSTDKLDRFLIDEKTNEWFNKNVCGIDRLKYLFLYEKYPSRVKRIDKLGENISGFFYATYDDFDKNVNRPVIENVHIQKIGTVLAKANELSVYNVEIQTRAVLGPDDDPNSTIIFIITIGNLNAEGLVKKE